MMNKISVNQEEFNFRENDFPILIHGKEGSGASLYTMTMAVNLFSQDFSLVFLCGYHMAEEEFIKQLDGYLYKEKAIFYTKEKTSEFKEFVINPNNANRIIFIKNIELFKEDILELVFSKNNIVLSGDVDKSDCRQNILNKKFCTKIFFSSLGNMTVKLLQKYEGFLTSNNLQGITKVKFH